MLVSPFSSEETNSDMLICPMSRLGPGLRTLNYVLLLLSIPTWVHYYDSVNISLWRKNRALLLLMNYYSQVILSTNVKIPSFIDFPSWNC